MPPLTSPFIPLVPLASQGRRGGVEPDIDALDQVPGQMHVIVAEEDHMGAGLGPPDEMRPFLNQSLPCLVSRMGLASKDELPLVANWSTNKAVALGREATGSVFVGREAARKA
jgi:hypothetical protein